MTWIADSSFDGVIGSVPKASEETTAETSVGVGNDYDGRNGETMESRDESADGRLK